MSPKLSLGVVEGTAVFSTVSIHHSLSQVIHHLQQSWQHVHTHVCTVNFLLHLWMKEWNCN